MDVIYLFIKQNIFSYIYIQLDDLNTLYTIIWSFLCCHDIT